MEAVAKQRNSVIKRQRKEAEKLAKKTGPVIVRLKNVPTSNRKMRLVADLIRGIEVNQALSILKFQAKQGAARLEKLLISAMADWETKRGRIDESEILIKEIFVDGGKVLKRLRPAPQGRAHRVRKRSNHITLVIDTLGSSNNDVNLSPIEVDVPAETKAVKKTSTSPEAKKSRTKKENQ